MVNFYRDYLQEEYFDTTFTTYSQLSFTATRYENGVYFRCEADNIVMQNELEKPLQNYLFLTVMCELMRIWFYFFLFHWVWNIFTLFHQIFNDFSSTRGGCITAQLHCNWTSRCLFGLPLRFKSIDIETSHLVSGEQMKYNWSTI